jgi:hypothetical protein
MAVVVLAELNTAVSLLVVPAVAPGTTKPFQFEIDAQAPVLAAELQVATVPAVSGLATIAISAAGAISPTNGARQPRAGVTIEERA